MTIKQLEAWVKRETGKIQYAITPDKIVEIKRSDLKGFDEYYAVWPEKSIYLWIVTSQKMLEYTMELIKVESPEIKRVFILHYRTTKRGTMVEKLIVRREDD